MHEELHHLPARWREKSRMLHPFAPAAATAFEECATDLEGALRTTENQLLNLRAAAAASGYSERALRMMLDDGRLTDHGRKGAPRIRRGDLPMKPARKRVGEYNVDADAAELAARLTG